MRGQVGFSKATGKVETMETTSPRRGQLPINGLDLFYEVHGELDNSKPPPLLLIPGAFMATTSMTSWVNSFAKDRAVIVSINKGTAARRTPVVRCHMNSSPTMPLVCCVPWRSIVQR